MRNLLTPWRGVAASFALNGILLGSWASRIPAIVEKHDLSPGDLGLALLSIGVGALVSFPLAGRAADGWGAVHSTRWIAAFYLLSIVLIAIAPSAFWLGAALFFFGVCHGSMDVTMNTWATEVEKSMERSVMSSFHAMWSLGSGLGAGLGFVATSLGLGVVTQFTGVSVLAAILFGPFMAIAWRSDIRAASSSDPVFAFPRGALILIGLIALSAGIGEGAMVDWSAVFLSDVVGTGEAAATLGYGVFSVTMVAMRLIVDRLVTRFGPVRVARASGLAAAFGVALATGLATFPAALAGFFLLGVGYAALIPLAFSRAAADPVVPPGQGIASVATLGYGAMLLGPPAIGFVSEATSLRAAFLILGVFALLVSVLAPHLSHRTRDGHSDPITT